MPIYVTATLDYTSVADQVHSDKELPAMLDALQDAFGYEHLDRHVNEGGLEPDTVKFLQAVLDAHNGN